MADLGTIQDLKNAINDTIYANDAGLVNAEILQEMLIDVIDTLKAVADSIGADLNDFLENENDLEKIMIGDETVATQEWMGAQTFGEILPLSQKGAANGVCELDSTGKVPAGRLPAYVDDVQEYANLAAFPAPGTIGVIYIALDTNLVYRWGGTVYVEIAVSSAAAQSITTADYWVGQEGGKLVTKYQGTVIESIDSTGFRKFKSDFQFKTNP